MIWLGIPTIATRNSISASCRAAYRAAAALALVAALLIPGFGFAQTVNYSYDDAGRLTGVDYVAAGSITYVYDDNGNLLQRSVESVTANQHLQVAVSPTGVGTIAADGIECPGDCDESYEPNEVVSLSANASPGFQFLGWGGDLTGPASPKQITMDADKSVTAYFGSTSADGTDGDGVPDNDEMGPVGSDPSFDGNDDGTPDYQQDSVASLLSRSGDAYLTLEAPASHSLSSVSAVSNPSPGDAPANAEFPYGFFEFSVTSLAVSGCTTVTLFLPADPDLNAYYKHGPTPDNDTPHWYKFTYNGQTGARILQDTEQTRMVLNLCDGLKGDKDLTANGTVVDPGGPVIDAAVLQINPGLNDAWFNAATAGQGFFIIVFEEVGIIFMAWFTYDTEMPPDDVIAHLGAAEHRWVTAQGPYEGDTATLQVFNTQGGVFDMSEPIPVTGDPIGTITIVWHDCESGTLTYDIDPPRVMGVIEISRIVPDNVALCETLAEQ